MQRISIDLHPLSPSSSTRVIQKWLAQSCVVIAWLAGVYGRDSRVVLYCLCCFLFLLSCCCFVRESDARSVREFGRAGCRRQAEAMIASQLCTCLLMLCYICCLCFLIVPATGRGMLMVISLVAAGCPEMPAGPGMRGLDILMQLAEAAHSVAG